MRVVAIIILKETTQCSLNICILLFSDRHAILDLVLYVDSLFQRFSYLHSVAIKSMGAQFLARYFKDVQEPMKKMAMQKQVAVLKASEAAKECTKETTTKVEEATKDEL